MIWWYIVLFRVHNQHCNRSIFETRDVIIIRWNVFFWFSRVTHIFSKEAYLFPFISFDCCCARNHKGNNAIWLHFSKNCKFHFILWISLSVVLLDEFINYGTLKSQNGCSKKKNYAEIFILFLCWNFSRNCIKLLAFFRNFFNITCEPLFRMLYRLVKKFYVTLKWTRNGIIASQFLNFIRIPFAFFRQISKLLRILRSANH